jgi:hypothetical protein
MRGWSMVANAGDSECADEGAVCSLDATFVLDAAPAPAPALAAVGDAMAAAGGVGGVGDAAAVDDLACRDEIRTDSTVEDEVGAED